MRASWMVLIALALAAVLLVAAAPVMAQEAGEEAPEGRGQVDSNALEELFRQVSEPCQLEMQQALDNNEEVSDECKAEIQAVIQRTEASRAAQQQNEAPEAAKATRWISPTFVTLVFVFAAVGGLVYYIIEENKRNPPIVRGSRSKKKEERDRRRGK